MARVRRPRINTYRVKIWVAIEGRSFEVLCRARTKAAAHNKTTRWMNRRAAVGDLVAYPWEWYIQIPMSRAITAVPGR